MYCNKIRTESPVIVCTACYYNDRVATTRSTCIHSYSEMMEESTEFQPSPHL